LVKIALIGNGAMGQMVADLAREAGNEVGAIITSENSADVSQLAQRLTGHQVAIDFSVANAVVAHVEACVRAGVPLVEGTTGWQAHEADVRRLVSEHQGALVFGANFSIGVNVFYRIAAHAAALLANIEGYDPFIEEAHHKRKRDAPSGTALHLRELLARAMKGREIPVSSTRAGSIPGTHRVGFDSAVDQITLTHMARSRQGFAAGALLAARWIAARKGTYEFSEVLDDIVRSAN
jgi:4-hydroxy-tetrahydrodipicolinate reductase